MYIGFMYGNIYDEEERFERQAVFPKLLAKHAEDFSWVQYTNQTTVDPQFFNFRG